VKLVGLYGTVCTAYRTYEYIHSRRQNYSILTSRFPRLIGIETTIIQPLVRTFGVDAAPFGHLMYQP
jgi:hypothetical protein